MNSPELLAVPSAGAPAQRHRPPLTLRRASAPIVLASLALALACGGSRDALEDHQALWLRNGPPSYQYTLTSRGFAPSGSVRVTVTNRVVTSTVPVGESPTTPDGQTMEQLFVGVAVTSSNCEVEVQYDETLGYPQSFYSDCGMEGFGWTVSDFVPLP